MTKPTRERTIGEVPIVPAAGAPAVGATYERFGDRPTRGAPVMVPRFLQPRLVIALLPFVVACGSSIRKQAPTVTPAAASSSAKPAPALLAAPAAERPAVEDPVIALIAESDRHF